MKALLILLVALGAGLVGLPAADAEDGCTIPPAELRRCGVAGYRIYVCGQFHDQICIWGP